MTWRGNTDVEKNSRTARRYVMPATARGMMNDGSPKLLNLREQIVSDTSKTAASPYTLWDGVSFTGLPCPFATLPPLVATDSARPQFVAP